MPSDRIEYHLGELETGQSPEDEDHNLPHVFASDKAILDIGCGLGQTFISLDLAKDPSYLLVGIDIDVEAMAYGQENFEPFNFTGSNADALPFANNSFDFVYSRVSLPYTNVPITLKEISRVLKPGGHIWISMHPQRMTWRQLTDSLRAGRIKEVIFRCYALVNGFSLHYFNRLFAWPSFLQRKADRAKKKYESFQTEKSIHRILKKEGFDQLQFVKDRHFVVTAKLPSLMDSLPINAPHRNSDLPTSKPQAASPSKPIPETIT